jgi:site-specific recombinase XerD
VQTLKRTIMKNPNSHYVELLICEMQLRNYSPRTIHSYSELMSKVENFYSLSFDQINPQQFRDYLLRRINGESISISMINQYISAFKIMQVDVLKHDWEPIRIKRPRRVRKLPVVLSLDEVERLISVTRNIKHKAIIMLAYSAGLRRQEIQLIKPSAIDSARMQVHVVQGKGKKDRYTILSPKALEILRLYYKYDRPGYYLFEAQGKKGNPLSDTTLNCIIKQQAAKAGIKKQVSFHTLRHCFATHLLEKGVNLRLIQQFMGHVSLKTTAVYLHLVNVNPSSVISPLDSMNV